MTPPFFFSSPSGQGVSVLFSAALARPSPLKPLDISLLLGLTLWSCVPPTLREWAGTTTSTPEAPPRPGFTYPVPPHPVEIKDSAG